MVLERGWAVAIVDPRSIQADNGAGLRLGIIGITAKGELRGPEDWGVLRAWAWGASRALDYFETDRDVDATRVAVEGLSRYGKAALVAMAYDKRFALGLIGSSGAGGAKLLRRDFGERVENLAAANEYHWMAGNFLKYAGPLTTGDLPVDAQHLIALCAPRPLFIGAGALEGDGWVDPHGSFLAAAAASPVYELLGVQGLSGVAYPDTGVMAGEGALAFRRHAGGHTAEPNWPAYLQFAQRHFTAPCTVTPAGKGSDSESGADAQQRHDSQCGEYCCGDRVNQLHRDSRGKFFTDQDRGHIRYQHSRRGADNHQHGGAVVGGQCDGRNLGLVAHFRKKERHERRAEHAQALREPRFLRLDLVGDQRPCGHGNE